MTSEQINRLRQALSEVYKPDMVDYCVKNHKYIEIDGKFISCCNSKPAIHAQMWYDDTKADPGNSYSHFEDYNINFNAPDLLDRDNCNYYLIPGYWRYPDAPLLGIASARKSDNPPTDIVRDVTPADRKAINTAIQEVIDDFKKRLKMYYKKYPQKVYSAGYWVDR